VHMAAKKTSKKNDRYIVIKKIFAGVAMLAFLVTIAAGLKSEVRFETIAYRSTAVMFVVFIVSRVVVKAISGYEEMNSDKV
jgi:hypothetical protein